MKYLKYLILGLAISASIVWATQKIGLSQPIQLSTQLPDLNGAYKSKLVRTSAGMLVAVFGDFVENDPAHYVYDAKESSLRPARDVFITVCDGANDDCSVEAGWSSPINISNTALLSSMQTDWNGDGNRTDYHGDSDNPHIFGSGNHVVVTWVDKYCDSGGVQRSVVYPESANREIAMSCTYVARASGAFADPGDWTVERLSDGSRDAKQDVSRGLSSGAWIITWQEDPLGLQPGEAEGPGDGSSGAKTSGGTDIWYAYTSNVSGGAWSTPVRLTDNQTLLGLPPDQANPLRDTSGDPVDPAAIEFGEAGASRPNIALVGGSSPPTTVIAYEESKAAAGLDQGKFVRFHQFAYNSPPTAASDKAGCIVSDPLEGARRARLVTQTNPGSDSGIRFVLFWRQGLYNQGGPADIMARIGYKTADAASTGLRPADLSPAVDPGCYALDYTAAANLGSAPPLNISSNTPSASEANLSDSSYLIRRENARAHRAVLRGDDLYMGYIYSEDGIAADAGTLANYNFYVRRFNAANGKWQSPDNLSRYFYTALNVLEPRLQGMPGNGPGCTDPANITRPENCQNSSVIVAAWGTEDRLADNAGSGENRDLYVTRSVDKGENWEPITGITGVGGQSELQLRTTPDGNRLFAVWNDTVNGETESLFSQGLPESYTPVDGDSGSGASCSIRF